MKLIRKELPLEIIGDFGLKSAGVFDPIVEKRVRLLDIDEEMRGFTEFERRT